MWVCRLLTCCARCVAAPQGIVNRLAVDEAEVEERVFVEAITNQYESREAVKYAGTVAQHLFRCQGTRASERSCGGRQAWLCCRCCVARPFAFHHTARHRAAAPNHDRPRAQACCLLCPWPSASSCLAAWPRQSGHTRVRARGACAPAAACPCTPPAAVPCPPCRSQPPTALPCRSLRCAVLPGPACRDAGPCGLCALRPPKDRGRARATH